MLKVYHAPNTRSIRVVWALEELGIPHEVKKLAFNPKELQSAEYLGVHPLGKVPAIQDDGFTMTESGAIVEYLVAKYGKGKLMPAYGSNEYGACLMWIHFAEATLTAPLGSIAQHSFALPQEKRLPQVVAMATEQVKRMLGIIDKELAGKEFILGKEFSAADIMLGYSVHLAKLLRMPVDDYANVAAYYARLASRPGLQKALA